MEAARPRRGPVRVFCGLFSQKYPREISAVFFSDDRTLTLYILSRLDIFAQERIS